MYFTPRKHKCGKCGFEMNYSQSESHSFLPISEDGEPFCYKCLIEFIAKNVPVMSLAPDKAKEPDTVIGKRTVGKFKY